VNDDFLIRSGPEIPPRLEARIRERLAGLPASPGRGWRKSRGFREAREWLGMHRALALAIGLIVLAGCATGLVRIAGFVFEEGSEPPATPPAGAVPVPQRVVSRGEAMAALSFEVRLPTWAPEGYELTDQVMVTLPEDQASLTEAWQLWLHWENDAGQQVLLLAFPSEYYRGDALEFGPAAVEEIVLDGTPAAAVRGNWGVGRWEERLGGNVLWVRGDTAYWLQAAWVSLEDLLRMAESQP